jgi:hypothetical protein
MHKGKQGEIFAVAFMDLSGAYDSVCRELMFEKLHKLVGLSEYSLATLQCLYNNTLNTQCIVKGQYSLSEPFSVTSGVRQGCPLSTKKQSLPPVNWRWVEEGDGYVGRLQPHGQPLRVGVPSGLQCLVPYPYRLSTTLFNLFISNLHDYITQRCPGKGVRVRLPGGTRQHSVMADLGYADDIALCANQRTLV